MHSYLILNEKQVYFPFASFGSPLVRLCAFSLDLNAVQIAQINGLSRTTINRHMLCVSAGSLLRGCFASQRRD